ncbi:MAG: hypothetical protein WCH31_09980 [Actinomycetes bacterium]
MRNPVRLLTFLVLLALVAAAIVGPSSAVTTNPYTLTLENTAAGVLIVITADGTNIRTATAPGTIISPGTYQIIFNNDVPDGRDVQHAFRFQGPGVNLQTDMSAGDDKTELFDVILQPNGTYTFADDRLPTTPHVVVTTATTATTPATSTSSEGGSTSSSTGKSPNSSVISSKTVPNVMRGSLGATVDSSSKTTLTLTGRTVSKLSAGHYLIKVTDSSTRNGFTLQHVRAQPVAVSGASFKGSRSVNVALAAGQWMYYATGGTRHYFLVTG